MKEQLQINYTWTTNPQLAALYASLGFQPRQDNPITRVYHTKGETTRHEDTFWFSDHAATEEFGDLDSITVSRVWRGHKEAVAAHPLLAVVIDYIKTTIENQRIMHGLIKSSVVPMVAQQVDGRTLFMPLGASDDLRRRVKKMISET